MLEVAMTTRCSHVSPSIGFDQPNQVADLRFYKLTTFRQESVASDRIGNPKLPYRPPHGTGKPRTCDLAEGGHSCWPRASARPRLIVPQVGKCRGSLPLLVRGSHPPIFRYC